MCSRGITAFELPPPGGADALPPAVQRAIAQLCRSHWAASAIPMLEKMASPKCRAVWCDWTKLSKAGAPCAFHMREYIKENPL